MSARERVQVAGSHAVTRHPRREVRDEQEPVEQVAHRIAAVVDGNVMVHVVIGNLRDRHNTRGIGGAGSGEDLRTRRTCCSCHRPGGKRVHQADDDNGGNGSARNGFAGIPGFFAEDGRCLEADEAQERKAHPYANATGHASIKERVEREHVQGLSAGALAEQNGEVNDS